MKDVIDLKNAYFHGVAGLEINFNTYAKDALYYSMLKLHDIIEYRGIYRETKRALEKLYY